MLNAGAELPGRDPASLHFPPGLSSRRPRSRGCDDVPSSLGWTGHLPAPHTFCRRRKCKHFGWKRRNGRRSAHTWKHSRGETTHPEEDRAPQPRQPKRFQTKIVLPAWGLEESGFKCCQQKIFHMAGLDSSIFSRRIFPAQSRL